MRRGGWGGEGRGIGGGWRTCALESWSPPRVIQAQRSTSTLTVAVSGWPWADAGSSFVDRGEGPSQQLPTIASLQGGRRGRSARQRRCCCRRGGHPQGLLGVDVRVLARVPDVNGEKLGPDLRSDLCVHAA